MKNIIVSCFAFLLMNNVFAQYDSSKLSPLIRKIVCDIDSEGHNWSDEKYMGTFYQQRHDLDFFGMRKRAKTFEMLALTNHPNPYIRIQAFDALLDSAYPKFCDILELHKNDTIAVLIQGRNGGCIWYKMNVIETMLNLVYVNKNWMDKIILSEEDSKRLGAISDFNDERKKLNQ